MKAKSILLVVSALAAAPALAQGELLLGYLTAETGPFVSLSRTNEVAARIAVGEGRGRGKGANHKQDRFRFHAVPPPR